MYRNFAITFWKPLGLLLIGSGLFLCYLVLKPVPYAVFPLGESLLQGVLNAVGLLFALPIMLPASTRKCVEARSSLRWLARWTLPGSVVPLLLACTLLGHVIGYALLIFNTYVLHLVVLSPGWSDVGFLGSYLFSLPAILLLSQRRQSLVSHTRITFDVLIIMAGIVTLSWYFVLGPTIQEGTGSLPARLVATAYPLITLMLVLCLCLLVMHNSALILRPDIFLLLLSFVLITFIDMIHYYLKLHNLYTKGNLLDLCLPLGFMLLGLAARALYVLPRPEPEIALEKVDKQPALWQSLFPYIWIPIVGLLLPFTWLYGGDPFLTTGVLVGAVVLFGLMLVRQLLAIYELHTLYINNDALAAANTQLEIQATHDELTGLPNRNFLQKRLVQAAHIASKGGAPAALLLLDLDRFKEVNDTLGHDVGDLLLQEIGPRLQKYLRPGDLTARLGGDEFAIVLPATNAAGAILTAQNLLEALTAPFLIDDHAFEVGGSIGIALIPEHGIEISTLLRCADVAMYVAKHHQIGHTVYKSEIDQNSPRKLSLIGELRQAIAEDGLLLHYQPKVALSSGRMVGVEALVRWPHPVFGLIQPDEFIPLAEHSGLIGPLTHWVLRCAVRQCREWEQAGLLVNVAVNLSTRTLYDKELLSTVTDILQTYEISPSRLTCEITESTLMEDPEGAYAVLADLRALGISISIDDFGTGYSSLAYLKRLPIDEVKIDKTFVLGLGLDADPADMAIVRAIVAMAHPLHSKVVAEGVESWEAWMFLRNLGCDIAQGYYLSRPLPAAALEQWARTSSRGIYRQEAVAVA